MTNRIKTVQNPRVILVALSSPERIMSMLSAILDSCAYNTCIDDFSENTDFVIESAVGDNDCPAEAIADTVVYENGCPVSAERISQFRSRVTSYENFGEHHENTPGHTLTFSAENYGADVAVRNLSGSDGRLSFDMIGNGILSRISMTEGRWTVEEVLICTAVLLAAGMPMAAIVGYFDNE